jgi:modulator of FtsH protease HflC
MKLNFLSGALLALLLALLIVGYGSLFIINQTQQGLVVRLGKVVDTPTDPGLHVKYPIIDSVIYIDKRILDLENSSQEIIAADQKRLVVDAFARYRIHDPLKFYQTVGSIDAANSRLSTLLNADLRRVLGEATLTHIVRDEREALMARVRDQLDQQAQEFGIRVVDVRIRRADLPDQNSQFVYTRMQTERQREAAEFRGQGSQRAQEIRARADRDVTVLLAEALSKAEQTRGEGDAERNKIFADAFSKDPEFFAFYRSMQAYEAGLKHGDTRMILKPDSDFFRYFADPNGKGGQAEKSSMNGGQAEKNASSVNGAQPEPNASSANGGPEKNPSPTNSQPDKGANSTGIDPAKGDNSTK